MEKQEFNFYQDVKVTMWVRSYFSIEAYSKEEALNKVKEFYYEDINDTDSSHLVGDYEWLHDTAVNMEVKDNDGFATIEVYDMNTHECIGCNGKY